MAKDVSAFLVWTAEPKLENRHRAGHRGGDLPAVRDVLAYLAYRSIWAEAKRKVAPTGAARPGQPGEEPPRARARKGSTAERFCGVAEPLTRLPLACEFHRVDMRDRQIVMALCRPASCRGLMRPLIAALVTSPRPHSAAARYNGARLGVGYGSTVRRSYDPMRRLWSIRYGVRLGHGRLWRLRRLLRLRLWRLRLRIAVLRLVRRLLLSGHRLLRVRPLPDAPACGTTPAPLWTDAAPAGPVEHGSRCTNDAGSAERLERFRSQTISGDDRARDLGVADRSGSERVRQVRSSSVDARVERRAGPGLAAARIAAVTPLEQQREPVATKRD